MSKRLSISLVIPAYNEESHLEACLSSALAQDMSFAEIIVVDNASSDRTVAVAEQFPDVLVIREPKRGIVHARDTGFNAARGDIIARIDADTVLPSNWSAYMTRFYLDAAHTNTAWTGGGQFADVPLSRFVSATYGLAAFRANQLLVGVPTLWGSNMALPRQLWNSVSNKTCRVAAMHEDLDLTLHLKDAGVQIYYDKYFPVTAQLRRAMGSRRELWDYLQWWPNTLKLHSYKSWRLCWVVGVLPFYLATPLLGIQGALKRGTAQLLAAFET
jgi:glycosyltransferase involved in cell wall biosynthesis